MTCPSIIKSGERRDLPCGKPAKFGIYCGTHKKNATPALHEEKAQLGQFMTTNTAHILQDIQLPVSVTREQLVEPFCGEGDLITHYGFQLGQVECWDIQPRNEFIAQRDTLLNPPDYTGRFVVTNPPYLARNKATDKAVFERWQEDDLYKCFLKILLVKPCLGGILILPVNFLLAGEVFKQFVAVYQVEKMNVFEERVFEDTSSSVCSFLFRKRGDGEMAVEFPIRFHPGSLTISFLPSEANDYLIGGEIYHLQTSGKYVVKRGDSHLVVKCIDDSNPIGLERKEQLHTNGESDRAYLSLVVHPEISRETEDLLITGFNGFLKSMRDKYHSMFLTSFREGERKRITFSLVYLVARYVLDRIEPRAT